MSGRERERGREVAAPKGTDQADTDTHTDTDETTTKGVACEGSRTRWLLSEHPKPKARAPFELFASPHSQTNRWGSMCVSTLV